ncbi:RIP metalloprotease RseP [candidate division KSB1 bacterium]|nr:RIP metalloprotease RseP [candidate division KSB1 bacterium]
MITPLIAFIVVVGFLVFVHELGHFAVAKWVGVRVTVFSIGFGPKIVGFRRGETDYRIAAFPLGGYVKMAGHEPNEELTGAPDEFASRTVLERMLIIAAGPVMNVLWAIIFIAIIFYSGIEKPLYFSNAVTIGWVENESPAARAGMHIGDKILQIADKEIHSWEEFYDTDQLYVKDTVDVRVQRQDEQFDLFFISNDSLRKEFPLLGLSPPIPAQVGRLVDGFPAEKAGMHVGDRILSINGDSIHSFYQMTRFISTAGDSVLNIKAARADSILDFALIAKMDKNSDRYMIGIAPFQETQKIKFGVVASLKKSVETNIFMSTLLGDFISRVFRGEASGDEIGGPIKIAEMAGEAARSGLLDVVRLMGFLSLQLGLLNLLPIPVFDGGHLFLLTMEGVMRRPLSQSSREVIQMVGLFIIISLMVFVFYNDIASILSRK